MSEFKIIISGQLQFQSKRAFDQVVEQYNHRMEHYYKNDILVKAEDIFNEELLNLDIPRTVLIGTERHWLNTHNLLERVVTFSIAGNITMWRLSLGTVVDQIVLEPKSDRTTVQLFNRGRELMAQDDQEQEALKMMTKVVNRFERHAQAYERRGFVNISLGNTEDALYDYSKSLKINPGLPEAHYGRGLVYSRKQEYEKAAADFEAVTKNSIPHQALYWMAQVALGDSLMELGRPADALRLYNMFTKRKQRIAALDRYDRRVGHLLGNLMTRAGRQNDALSAFQHALESEPDAKAPDEKLIRRDYATVLRLVGKKKEADQQDKISGYDTAGGDQEEETPRPARAQMK